MKSEEAMVFVVDDDPSVREALSSLFRSTGLRVETFASAPEFLRYQRPDVAACLVLDVRMPVMSGLDLQRELVNSGDPIPIIFITGHGDIAMSVGAMKAGAVEFLPKPFHDQDLLDAVLQAHNKNLIDRQKRASLTEIRKMYDKLTARERDVIALTVRGMLNKQIAGELGISEATIKVHRHNIMQKMEANSLPELVRIFEKLGLSGLDS